ncbi:MAG: hypothetical protein A2700_00330 [Candidatus Blackburnbacteria bacterium RIFCSPHIGHO2_01_FULL_44_64]|uniref:TNase-like domain-containing protein n=1 Tax=Candidatus Blackburnbacteria bacterium RIFCSPHIGHO2_02_FULL_44_20 TaxID=1797516 RepID=A0A1G1V7H9_9BACT|nr:MAG: hypothetical protein A2700_00330 [Candidatus Blackburnbacteria bacterium RIFCSPHIGHO2_01_FULL_44_64]OGY10224.1 MAG: hypothetical protein A3E16_03375 [Candidatus Blackburnbacteria bacterium RIFCSPHIGHO2_12_FULL_44_25]OGY11365.1 MAG: hypothetical protein A3D26_02570 [Candidatus Blackburnbacteria bacterium RIFCSPHIGHO2_02_FULL_44_20]OGY13541.1 MAG: hypothetical protein A3A62_00995 [Candidatus Blackburnbacteria bacterium RIFCSPLOWO2_01_FULL_44_43]OGY16763.1 MAG: hypothetical protein A3H88_0
MRKPFIPFIGVLLLALGLYALFVNQPSPPTTLLDNKTQTTPAPAPSTDPPNDPSTFLVTRVIDGDTIEIQESYSPEQRRRVRYIGIDTPETVHPDKEVECFGREAKAENERLVLGKNIKLEKDISETDKYGRLLRYLWVENVFINDFLVRQGYAKSSTYPPDIKYQSQFSQAEKEARDQSRGLWAPNACNSNTPNIPTGCTVKGNINAKGEKIYHTPGQKYYYKTQIDETAGERYFCSEEEAENAGWRKSKV